MNTENSKEIYCGYNDFRRARYFDGEILNKQIFETEQSYHHEKRKLLNRMLHGWGVVCGLDVRATNPPSSNIIVEQGMALDCHGNEIFVCEDQTVDLTAKTCVQKTAPSPCQDSKKGTQTEKALYVVIRYQEIPSDRAPSYAPSGNCEDKTCDYSRTREGFCIEVWDHPPKMQPKPNIINMPCSEPFKCPPSSCCPDQHYIVLATIRCGERTYMFSSNSTIKVGENETAEISFQIGRKISSVCIDNKKNINDNNPITIRDVYKFNTNYFFNGFQWDIKWTKPGEYFSSNEKNDEINQDYVVDKTYIITPNEGVNGSVYLEIPVSFSFLDNKIKIDKPLNLTLKSPMYIGDIELTRGSIISDAMIRNMENRQSVITYPLLYPLLSSLLNICGCEEGQISSDNLIGYFCSIMESSLFPVKEYGKRTKTEISKELEEKHIKEIVEEYLKSEKEKKPVETTKGSRYGDIKK